MVSMGLAAAWCARGRKIAVFKKGPDFIDASWLSLAARRPCRNLDTYLMGEDGVRRSFSRYTSGVDAAVIEGNRGLFDGTDASGTHSSARLARLLGAPVVLVVDCTKSTRTVAASVLGCQKMDPDLALRGVILNRLAGPRHAEVVERSIIECCGLEVLGALPRGGFPRLPERHLGLVPTQEYGDVEGLIRACRQSAEACLNIDALWSLAQDAPPLPIDAQEPVEPARACDQRVRVGVLMDSSFHFYYPENMEALEARGGEIVRVSPSHDARIPQLDALYIGGGFPETHAALLAENRSFRTSLRQAVEGGLPVYAECGGAMYLGNAIEVGGSTYPMVGVFPLVFRMHKRPQGHGYTLLEVDKKNPYFEVGTHLKGHEFHYSRVVSWGDDDLDFVCRVKRGWGFDGRREGLCHKGVFATFTHLHSSGEPRWAEALLFNGLAYRRSARPAAGSPSEASEEHGALSWL